jgi:4-amino-4-deoxy-L-arabinose transferase-like glycosyltransferase
MFFHPLIWNQLNVTQLSNKWIYFILILVTILGMQLRLQAVRYTIVDTPVRADAKDYLLYAANLKQFHIYSRSPDALEGRAARPMPDALRAPGYPFFLRMFMGDSLTDNTLFGIELAQAVLSTLSILLAYFAFAALLKPPLALLVALFTAISPHLVTANVFLLSESLSCFLLLLFLWMLSRWRSQTTNLLMLSTGLIFALATLTRPWTQYFIIFLVPLIALAAPLQKPKRAALIMAIGFIVPLALWSLRNLLTLGVFGDNTLTINTLYHGLYPGMMYENNPETLGYPYRFDPRAAEIGTSIASVLTEIIRRFREFPLDYLQWYLFGKPVMLFSWNIYEGMGDVFIYPVLRTPYAGLGLFKATHWIMQTLHYVLVGLAGIACMAAWLPGVGRDLSADERFFARCTAALFIYFVLVHCLGAPFARYSIPMQPVIYGLAMFGLETLWNRLKPFLTIAAFRHSR